MAKKPPASKDAADKVVKIIRRKIRQTHFPEVQPTEKFGEQQISFISKRFPLGLRFVVRDVAAVLQMSRFDRNIDFLQVFSVFSHF
jgi:hypothetical protein